jgi:chorismate dehydratase
LLRQGKLDAALVSSSEYFTGEYRVVAGCCISSSGPGSDAMLVTRVPYEKLNSIALSAASLSTNLMLRMLMHWLRPGAAIKYAIRPEDPIRSLSEFDGCLLIGDEALCTHECASHCYDLGELWQSHTQLPMVFTLWLVRDNVDPSIATMIREAYKRGMREINEIINDESARTGIDKKFLKRYFCKSLDYSWSDAHSHALSEFGRALFAMGLISRMPEISYFETA